DKIENCIKDFITKQRRRLTEWIKNVYQVQNFEEVGIRAPEWADGKFVFYGFVGCFTCGNVLIEVKPKVGWDGFFKMIYDVINFFSTTPLYPQRGAWIGALLNALSLGRKTPVEYSVALLNIANKLLSLYGPLKIEFEKRISEGEIGKVDYRMTTKLFMRDLPLGVYKRASIAKNALPLLLLKHLNKRVLNDLEKLEARIEEKTLKDELAVLLSKHRKLESGLRHYAGRCCTSEQLREIFAMSRGNPLLRSLASLYLDYIHNKELIKDITNGNWFNIISTHKLYELWILVYLLKYLKDQSWTYDRVVSWLDLLHGGVIKLRRDDEEITVEYNKRISYQMKHQQVTIRPDFIIRTKRKTLVIDAKYRSELSMSDIQKIITYISLISHDSNCPSRYAGAVAYLGDDDVLQISRGYINIELYLCKATPNNLSKCIEDFLQNNIGV
ncbi:MAG: hypothetical protein QW680_05295, partial [Pyrobaculum sp.]